MRVRWNDQAKEQLRQASYYIRRNFGKNTRDSFISRIRQLNKQLCSNPLLGKEEPLLASRPINYRSIVATPINKIVYHINGKHIEVDAFWDTRREPNTLIKDLEDPKEG